MFTGIVEHVGRLESLTTDGSGGRLRIHAGPWAESLSVAGSIAVNGCCLTAVEVSRGAFAADLSPETLARTTFGQIKAGTRVNLERPLAAGKELGGHFVQGHVDGVGKISRLERQGENWWLEIRVPPELERYIAMKGSIAIDGISLTVAALNGALTSAAIIPFTYANTNLQSLSVGDSVNIETDVLAKYLETLLQKREKSSSNLTIARLAEEGFA